MGKIFLTKNGWYIDVILDARQFMFGANYYRVPWPMWNVFIGPLRIGGSRQFASGQRMA